jgi:RecB family endonuclease NucS
VIELKRKATSDAAVGQVLRYIGWVKKHLAKDGQNVRGIIIAASVDDSLRYAASNLSNVSVKTYSVTFSLQPEELSNQKGDGASSISNSNARH